MWLKQYASVAMVIVVRVSLVVGLASALAACNAGFGRSSDNDLQSLSVTGGTLTPAFSRTETEYTMLVGGSTDDVEVIAVVESETATLKVNGEDTQSGFTVTVALDAGRNEVEIQVTAENEQRKIYTVVITKSDQVSSDATLRALTLANVSIEGGFSGDQLSYQSTVNYLVNQTAVALEKNSQFAKASVSNQANNLSDNEFSAPIFLRPGETNNIAVSVQAEDSSQTNLYEVDVDRGNSEDLALATFVKASNSGAGDSFAQAIAAGDEIFVVGAPAEQGGDIDNQNNNGVTNAGAAYVFQASGGVWSQRSYLKAHEDIAENDRFGAGVATAGDWIAVGAPGRSDEAGVVYLYSRSGSEWLRNGTLAPADGVAGDGFGETLAMSSWVEPGLINTEFLFVAAPGRSAGQGAVYVYRRDAGVWNLIATQVANDGASNDAFGSALSVNTYSTGLEYAVGAPGKDGDSGAAYVFRKNAGGSNEWAQVDKVEANNRGGGDAFGSSVGFAGDVLAVGAPSEDSSINGVVNFNNNDAFDDNDDVEGSGAVYTFSRTTDEPNFLLQAYLKASRDVSSAFGSALALSGGMLAVGAPKDNSGAIGITDDNNASDLENSGAVHLFSLTNVSWARELFAKSLYTDDQDEFGGSLAFFGEALFIGIPGENSGADGIGVTTDENAENSGAVYILQ